MNRDNNENGQELEPVLDFLSSLWALNHALERASLRMESVLGLTAQQRFAIRILGKLPGTTPGDLAKLLHVDRGSVTALIKRLEARDLITRKPDVADGRRVFLSLSARGRKFDVPTPISVERAVAVALGRSTQADLAAVRRVLGRLVSALDEISSAGDED